MIFSGGIFIKPDDVDLNQIRKKYENGEITYQKYQEYITGNKKTINEANSQISVVKEPEKQKSPPVVLPPEKTPDSEDLGRICKFCGNQLKPGAIRCISCGKYISGSTGSEITVKETLMPGAPSIEETKNDTSNAKQDELGIGTKIICGIIAFFGVSLLIPFYEFSHFFDFIPWIGPIIALIPYLGIVGFFYAIILSIIIWLVKKE